MLTQDDPPSTGNDGPCTHAYHIPAAMSVEMTAGSDGLGAVAGWRLSWNPTHDGGLAHHDDEVGALAGLLAKALIGNDQ